MALYHGEGVERWRGKTRCGGFRYSGKSEAKFSLPTLFLNIGTMLSKCISAAVADQHSGTQYSRIDLDGAGIESYKEEGL